MLNFTHCVYFSRPAFSKYVFPLLALSLVKRINLTSSFAFRVLLLRWTATPVKDLSEEKLSRLDKCISHFDLFSVNNQPPVLYFSRSVGLLFSPIRCTCWQSSFFTVKQAMHEHYCSCLFWLCNCSGARLLTAVVRDSDSLSRQQFIVMILFHIWMWKKTGYIVAFGLLSHP